MVNYYSHRLQIQERLGSDIVNYIWDNLSKENKPKGMAIILKGEHLCKTMRGVKKQGIMTTSYLKGIFLTDIKAREELYKLIS